MIQRVIDFENSNQVQKFTTPGLFPDCSPTFSFFTCSIFFSRARFVSAVTFIDFFGQNVDPVKYLYNDWTEKYELK